MEQQFVQLVSDGSCLGNPGRGGWACLLKSQGQEKMLSGGEQDTTNNRMELMAVIRGLQSLKRPCQVEIITDSQYIMKAFTEKWLENWQRNNWRTAQKKPVKNQDLWVLLLEATKLHKISWRWVKGHSGDVDNERVDAEARNAATQI
ncbi:MAG: ribonuclease HI [Oligoflexales bacterium]|nr:ribonuclease HI [Oligoflexales bacterium]